MISFLFSFFSKVLVASTLSDNSERSLVAALKISPYAAKDYAKAIQNYPGNKLKEIISLLKNSDLKLKGINIGSENEGQVFKELIFRIIL